MDISAVRDFQRKRLLFNQLLAVVEQELFLLFLISLGLLGIQKSGAYAEDMGKYYNMKSMIYEDEHYYVCHDGRELRHIRTETKQQEGYVQTFEVYFVIQNPDYVHYIILHIIIIENVVVIKVRHS